MDFLGAAVDVETAARALDGKAFLPTLDDATNSAGYVIFDHAGEEHQLDFMSQLLGVKYAEVNRTAIPATTPSGTRFRVMQPVVCAKSRIHNTALKIY